MLSESFIFAFDLLQGAAEDAARSHLPGSDRGLGRYNSMGPSGGAAVVAALTHLTGLQGLVLL